MRTVDAQGKVLALHIDLRVVGGDDLPSPAKKGKLRRLIGG